MMARWRVSWASVAIGILGVMCPGCGGDDVPVGDSPSMLNLHLGERTLWKTMLDSFHPQLSWEPNPGMGSVFPERVFDTIHVYYRDRLIFRTGRAQAEVMGDLYQLSAAHPCASLQKAHISGVADTHWPLDEAWDRANTLHAELVALGWDDIMWEAAYPGMFQMFERRYPPPPDFWAGIEQNGGWARLLAEQPGMSFVMRLYAGRAGRDALPGPYIEVERIRIGIDPVLLPCPELNGGAHWHSLRIPPRSVIREEIRRQMGEK